MRRRRHPRRAQVGQVERRRHVPGLMSQQRVHRRLVPHKVAILLPARVEPRVKLRPAPRRRHDANILGQPGVQGENEFARGHFELRPWNLDMRHHAERMHTGVRAAGPVHARPAGKEFGQGFLDLLLHAQADLLHLPALVVRAVVGDGQFEFDRFHALEIAQPLNR